MGERLLFDAQGTYRIQVFGRLDAACADMLGVVGIRTRRAWGKYPVTTLTGQVIDQASLMGVLTALYEMGFTLLNVKRLPDPH